MSIELLISFKNSSCGKTTYTHSKAGMGRSTTGVLCYLVEYKCMTPAAALEHVWSIRPRVLLAPSQWQAVQEFKQQRLASIALSPPGDSVLITKADLEGYDCSCDEDDDSSKELVIVPRVVARTSPMIARLSCLFASLKVSGGCVPVTRQLTVTLLLVSWLLEWRRIMVISSKE